MSKNKNINNVDYILDEINQLRKLFNSKHIKDMNDKSTISKKRTDRDYLEIPKSNIKIEKNNIDVNSSEKDKIHEANINKTRLEEMLNSEKTLNNNDIKVEKKINVINVNDSKDDVKIVSESENKINIDQNIKTFIKENKAKKNKISSQGDSRIQKILDNLENQVTLLVTENSRLRQEKLKVLADSENKKRLLNQEMDEYKKYSNSSLVKSLLPALDNLERAISINSPSNEVKNFLIGFQMIYTTIQKAFSDQGIYEIPTKVGDEFNSSIHNGIEIVETKEYKSGTVTKVLQKGYKINNRIIRAVSVNIEK